MIDIIRDATDFAILFAVKQHEVPPWKNKIHGWIIDNQDVLPHMETVSVQTVGRRVDNLVKNDFLETVIVSPDGIKRDLIIAFKLTEKGAEAVAATRDHMLGQAVDQYMFDQQHNDPMKKDAVATLLADRFDIAVSALREEYGKDELFTVLMLLYMEQAAEDVLGDARAVRQIAEDFTGLMQEFNARRQHEKQR